MITIKQFNDYVEMLDHHDWHYDYSEDINVWRRGRDQYKTLTAMAKQDPVYQEIFSTFSAYVYASNRKDDDYKNMVAKLMVLREQLRQAA